MNKQRRKDINECVSQIDTLQSQLDAIMKDEQDAYDNLPESLQESEKGEVMTNAIDNIQTAIDYLDDARSCLQDATE